MNKYSNITFTRNIKYRLIYRERKQRLPDAEGKGKQKLLLIGYRISILVVEKQFGNGQW